MSKQQPELDPQAVVEEFRHFIAGFESAVLATVNADGVPEASYAPVLFHEGHFYIFVSQLAAHTRNLLASQEVDSVSANISLLYIEPEERARNLFARQRATVQGRACRIDRNDLRWDALMDIMSAVFGETMKLVRQLPDFHLFEIYPSSASLVTGFAKAWKLEGPGLDQVSAAMR